MHSKHGGPSWGRHGADVGPSSVGGPVPILLYRASRLVRAVHRQFLSAPSQHASAHGHPCDRCASPRDPVPRGIHRPRGRCSRARRRGDLNNYARPPFGTPSRRAYVCDAGPLPVHRHAIYILSGPTGHVRDVGQGAVVRGTQTNPSCRQARSGCASSSFFTTLMPHSPRSLARVATPRGRAAGRPRQRCIDAGVSRAAVVIHLAASHAATERRATEELYAPREPAWRSAIAVCIGRAIVPVDPQEGLAGVSAQGIPTASSR